MLTETISAANMPLIPCNRLQNVISQGKAQMKPVSIRLQSRIADYCFRQQIPRAACEFLAVLAELIFKRPNTQKK